MKAKGSMTAAMCLMLLVIMSLLAACIRSARISCARVQASNAMDTALYSLFSQYDPDLLQDYHLFFLDGGYGENKLNLPQIITQTEAYASPVLTSGLTKCGLDACGIDSFQLASDQRGEAVMEQILRYMKDNLGNKSLQILTEQLNKNQAIMENQEAIQEGGINEAPVDETAPMEEISESNNPLEIIKNIRSHGFLGLVLPEGGTISENTLESQSLLSHRELEQGLNPLPLSEKDPGITDKILIQEYILESLSFYTHENHAGALDYQVEYVLGGKGNDKENLQYVVNRLLLIREASNIAFLYTDSQKRSELQACASALSPLLLIPEGMTLVQGVLAAGWAYVESISDVKILLSGGKVPLSKDASSWKTHLNHLSTENTSPGSKGLDYRDYLFLLLSFSSAEDLTFRCMDMIEQNIRIKDSRGSFSFDACLYSISVNFLISGPEQKKWQGQRFYTYKM